jgi:hypothetical protein
MQQSDARREKSPPLRLGELALRAGFLTQAQLQVGLDQQKKEATSGRLPRQLGLILLSLGFLDEENLIKLLAEQEKQRTQQAKMEAPVPQPPSKGGAGRQAPPPTLKRLPTLLLKPQEGSGGHPPARK